MMCKLKGRIGTMMKKDGCKMGGIIMCKLKGWMHKGEHYKVEMKG